MDDKTFKDAAEKIAVFSKKSMLDVCRQQAGLFVADAVRFTPPFGDAPMTEKWDEQRRIGEAAVSNDIQKGFKRVGDLRVVQEGKDIGKDIIRLLARRKNHHIVERILQKLRVATAGIVKAPTRDLHDRIRRSNGTIRSGRFGYLVTDWKSVPRFIKLKQKFVGLAKSGWKASIDAVNQFRARKIALPPWVKRHGGQGTYTEGQSGEKTFVEVSNSVAHAQKHSEKIMGRAWNNRLRNVQLQAQKQEQAMQRAAKKAGLS